MIGGAGDSGRGLKKTSGGETRDGDEKIYQ